MEGSRFRVAQYVEVIISLAKEVKWVGVKEMCKTYIVNARQCEIKNLKRKYFYAVLRRRIALITQPPLPSCICHLIDL